LAVVDKKVIVNGEPLPLPPQMKFSYLVSSRDEVHPRNLTALGLDEDDYYYMGRDNNNNAVYRMFLTETQVQSVRSLSFIRSFEQDRNDYSSPNEPLFPLKYSTGWTGDNYGPLWIPKKGATIVVNDSTLAIYGELITDYEGNKNVELENGKLTINGREISTYTFVQNYYFMMGDNRHNSLDSRYWGFVPEDHIVGKPLFVWFSMNEHASLFNMVRWKRIGRLIR
jgi:signal peptidase I